VNRVARRILLDLLTATEVINHEQISLSRRANSGQQYRSASVCETSNLSFSKPKGPAMPQQPESSNSTLAPVDRKSDI
jgi:hypothetical protein